MRKRLAIIGSSGGNLYGQGGNNPETLLGEVFTQAQSAEIEISFVLFVAVGASMDNISSSTNASLFTLQNGKLSEGDVKPLSKLNEEALNYDEQLAAAIAAGEIDGLISISSDPQNTNSASIKAAADKKIPIAGSGGTSMSCIQQAGARVISASGTTGTTNRTRAVAFIAALSDEFGLKYTPVIGKTGAGAQIAEDGPWKRISFRGIMMSALPGFIAMALVLAIGKIPGLDEWIIRVTGNEAMSLAGDGGAFSILVGALPIMLAAIAAKQVSGLDEIGIIAGIVAGFLSASGGVIGGIISGIIAGIFAYYIAAFCFKRKVPGTTVNIISGGFAGLAAGFIGMYAIAPIALWLGNGIRWVIDSAIAFNPALAGAMAGLLIWPAIMGGVYHAAILPIVLLEMEVVGSSFLGAVDMTGLVMVSAGITLANIVVPRTSGDRAAAIPGFFVNMAFGTFVEAAYPYMFSSKLVFFGALLASGVSGALVGSLGVRGTAYVASFAAPAMANEGRGLQFALCMLVALALAFAVTVINNRISKAKIPAEN